ncbi:MAG TPA: hypothetical protein VFW28_09730 [Micropepsaceae bacterium]|nr:hypothetical protein [Micropepsaceae bacterium]
MERVSEFWLNAEECLKMARKARNVALREQFLELARQWSLLAAAREQALKGREDKPH